MFAAFVLFPWLLFVLFLLQKRELRARQVLVDLCLLDGRAAPSRDPEQPFGDIPPAGLLDRLLDESFGRTAAIDKRGPKIREVQAALVERAFGEQEYLVGLGLMTVITASGWFSVFYPRGGVGLADIVARGADAWALWTYLLSGLTPVTAGFAGAYFFCVYALVRRYLDADLYPARSCSARCSWRWRSS